MKHKFVFATIGIFFLSISSHVVAGDSQSGQAIKHGVQAGSHASASVAHGAVGSAQVTSAASAVPLGVAGSAGAASTKGANTLMESATAPIGTPLDITDEAITAGPPPSKALIPKSTKEDKGI